MAATSVKIVLDLGQGTEIKEGSVITSSDENSACDLTDFATGLGVARKWATFEPDSWFLDGSYHILPSDGQAHVGFLSDIISNGSKNFSPQPAFLITLDGDYDIENSITVFGNSKTGDFCNQINFTFRDSGDSIIDSFTVNATSENYTHNLSATLENVRTITIEFVSTNVAYRHARLIDVIFDTIIFKGDEIQNANIIEEISLTSLESPGNSLEFTLHSDNSDFSIVDPQGIYALLERRQKIDVTAFIDNVSEYMGRFYLQDWDSENDKLAKFQAIDALQILGTIPFADAGDFFREIDNYTVAQTVADIFDNTGFDYEIDSSIASQYVHGWVPLGESCRSVLQNICLAHGAYITCSRSNAVQIKAIELAEDISTFDYVLNNSDLANRKIKQVPLVTGIMLVAHYWQDNNEAGFEYQLYDDNIEIGTYTFLTPGDVLMTSAVAGGTATKVLGGLHYLYYVAEITGAGTFTLNMGNTKRHVRQLYEQAASGIPAGTPENILEIENAYFVTPDNVAAVAQRILDYYSQKYELTAKLFASDITVGDSLDAETQKTGKRMNGVIEKTNINLVGLRIDLETIGNIVNV